MTTDELRADPYAWAFARRHRQMQPELARSRRRLRGFQVFVGAALVAGLSLFGVSVLSAGSPAVVGVHDAASGGLEVSVQPDAGPSDVVAELRAVIDDRGLGVRVETISGRDLVVGRIIGDGQGVSMLDSDPAMDYTATRVLFDPGANGVVSVVVATDGAWDLFVADMGCSTYRRPLAEVRGELVARGFDVVVTAVAVAEGLADSAFLVADATLTADDRVHLVAQPIGEIKIERPGCI